MRFQREFDKYKNVGGRVAPINEVKDVLIHLKFNNIVHHY